MKLVRFGALGSERPGLVDAEGRVRDAGSLVPDWSGEHLAPEALRRLATQDLAALPLAPEGVRFGSPVPRPGNFIAVGLNYADHAAETGAAIPAEPILFNKAPNCVVGPHDDVMLPRGSEKTDWEVELAVVIGRRAADIEEADALDYVAGFSVCNDVSERAYQTERGGQWMKGKGSPTFGPLGPWLVTPDEVADVQALSMWLDVNGRRAQTGSTSTMIFGVWMLVAYISRFLALDPGDIITTGTPPGVGMGMKPPVYLKAGDTIALGIEGLGEQRQTVVEWRRS